MPDAVLVVDMLRGFMEEGYPIYCGADSRKIIANIEQLLDEETKKGSKIFFIADCHAPDDLEFKMFPPHCIEGSPESEVIPELQRFAGKTISKQRYSAFFNTGLEKELLKLKPEKVIVCGVCTDICVMHTVADARNRDYVVEVPADCVASFDQEAHKWALQHMEKVLGARLTHAKEKK
ncbi:MAG: cysteine hydrolase [Dehalococcoidia bacterium]|nr:MAG: cysteine hydrolase [Dehalococcoidia bacterium]